jgi:hypothetical protein
MLEMDSEGLFGKDSYKTHSTADLKAISKSDVVFD